VVGSNAEKSHTTLVRCELVGDEERAGKGAAAAGQAGRVSAGKRHSVAHEASPPSRRARAERQAEESSPLRSLRRVQQADDDACYTDGVAVLASTYSFAERCTPRACPGWEMAMYALMVLKAAAASREEIDLALHAAFPASVIALSIQVSCVLMRMD